MIYGSVCSGIEAATAAWHSLGWKPAFFSEIDLFPRAVLQHHYPDVPLHGDFTTIGEDEYGPIDLLVGGTPCQSFSIAGLREGLDDDRGNLALEFLKLAQRKKPRWLVWENVPGVLSSNRGRDFGSILGGLVEIGYGFAYRVLDAQYFGVAQRRRRVFVVGYLGDWRRAAAVLFERHSLSGNPAPSRKAKQEIARTTKESFGSGAVGTLRCKRPGEGGVQGDFDHIVPAVSPALNTQSGQHHAPDTKAYVVEQQVWPAEVAPTLNAHFGEKMGLENQHISGGAGLFVRDGISTDLNSHVLTYAIQERAISENINVGPGGKGFQADHAYTLEARSVSQAVAFALRGREGESSRSYVAASSVRRLTPIECERLQGFPDNFTAIPWRNKSADLCPDGPRYKALGNSMAVPVMRWIGERIAAVDAIK